jgi:hypothetical protein
MDLDKLVETFLRYYEAKHEEDRWARDEVDTLVDSDPGTAWDVTCALLSKASSALAYIAAGPLENLLKRHGPAVIDRIEDESRRNGRVRLALSGAWIRPADAVFERWYSLMTKYGFADGTRRPL